MDLYETKNEIINRIKARNPILYLFSLEEIRVTNHLKDIARKMERGLYTWSFGAGLVNEYTDIAGTGSSSAPIQGTDTPDNVLKEVINIVKRNIDKHYIFLFKDFHPFLKDPFIGRRVKETAYFLMENSLSSLIMISGGSPAEIIPPDLQNEMTSLDFPLPDAAEISDLVLRMVNDCNSVDTKAVLPELANPEVMTGLVKALQGLTEIELENAIGYGLVSQNRLGVESIPTLIQEKRQILKKGGALEFYTPTEDLDQVGGLEALKEWLLKRAACFSGKARSFGVPAPKGVMLLGVPGCGKSLVAKAMARTWQLPLLRLDIGKVFGMYVGESEAKMRQAISMAESISPCILWIDEIEKGFGQATSSQRLDSGVTARVFGAFLTWMQEKRASVFVMATANDISSLPPEFSRKGRFDEIFFLDLPQKEERKRIFEIHLRLGLKDPGHFDLDELVEQTDGFSGADIEAAIKEAIVSAYTENSAFTPELKQRHLLEEIERLVPISITFKDKIQTLRNWAMASARLASAVKGEEPATQTSSLKKEEPDIFDTSVKREEPVTLVKDYLLKSRLGRVLN